MVIVHIASIVENQCDGVSYVVPEHVKNQTYFADVCFINIKGYNIPSIKKQFYLKNNSLLTLPNPYNHPDLVVFHQTYIKEYLAIYKDLVKRKITYIILPHGDLTKIAQKKKFIKKKIANILLFNSFINKAAALQCLSKQEMMNTHFSVSKIIGKNGVYIPNIKKDCFSTNKIQFTYIGRLEQYTKGLDLLIKSVSSIKDYLVAKNCVFDIYGPDILGRCKKLNKLIKHYNVTHLIKTHYPVYGKEKEDILLATDVFIQTSRTEGMPVGILEALAYGVPCLVTKGTNLYDDIQNSNSGWACETNVNAIAKNIILVLEEKDKLIMKGNNAVKMILNNFEWKQISEETVESYKKIIGYGEELL